MLVSGDDHFVTCALRVFVNFSSFPFALQNGGRLYRTLRDHFQQWNRVENSLLVMGLHPEYLEAYLKVDNHIYEMSSAPLREPDRFYIAIMVSVLTSDPWAWTLILRTLPTTVFLFKWRFLSISVCLLRFGSLCVNLIFG